MEHTFRKATLADLNGIMEIIEEAKRQMTREGKQQWDETYPARAHIENDIQAGVAHVIVHASRTLAYGATVFTGEPAYNTIQGHWLSDRPYVVLHRLAVTDAAKGHGVGLLFIKETERLALSLGFHSFRVDTNHDNERMLRLLGKTGFSLCGTIFYPKGSRMAFEKLL